MRGREGGWTGRAGVGDRHLLLSGRHVRHPVVVVEVLRLPVPEPVRARASDGGRVWQVCVRLRSGS